MTDTILARTDAVLGRREYLTDWQVEVNHAIRETVLGFNTDAVLAVPTRASEVRPFELDKGTMCQARPAEEVWDYERHAGHRVFWEGARSVCGQPEEGLVITVDVQRYGLVTYDTDEDALGRRAARRGLRPHPVAARDTAPLLTLGPWSPFWLVPWGIKCGLAVAWGRRQPATDRQGHDTRAARASGRALAPAGRGPVLSGFAVFASGFRAALIVLAIPAILAIGLVELSHAALDAFLQALLLRRLGLGPGPLDHLAQAIRALLALLGVLTHDGLPGRRPEGRRGTIVLLTSPSSPWPWP